MPLAPGTRIGPYEITSALGSGGMGVVYRARDTKLGRTVAIKALPELFASDPEHVARFAREAQLLATLNHPHIGGIHGLEEDHGSRFLILEYIDGQSLAERLAAGPLPLDEALEAAVQIAAALDAAHEKGIVHRDLKPGNIMLTAAGEAKVLDFGLARAPEPAAGASAMNSPTLTFAATQAGTILGTAAYMSPEQAKGKTVDKRADIWAFGAVLFEMLSGRRPFGGESISETIAAIIKDQPPLHHLPAEVPPALRALLVRLLEKDPRRRLRDIGDARLALEDLQANAAIVELPPAPAAPRSGRRWLSWLPWGLAALATAAALGVAAKVRMTPAPPAPLQYTLPITGDSLERIALPAISPDGRHVVFAKGGTLWIRSLDQLYPRQLPGTAGARYPFWSPDSREVAYLASGAIWRAGIDGTQPLRVAPFTFPLGGRTPGGVWLPDNRLVFAPAATGTGLFVVAVAGGVFTEMVASDRKTEADFHRPSLLPDGRSILFAVDRAEGGTDTLGVLADGARKDVLTMHGEALDSPVYSADGHILFHRETTAPGIWAVPFDVTRLETTGAPFLVASDGSYPSISATGIMVYAESSLSGRGTLAWWNVKNSSVTAATTVQFPSLNHPRLSPSGHHVAAVVQQPGQGLAVAVIDLQRNTYVRVGSATASTRPVWRDERTLIYSIGSGVSSQLVSRAADGSGGETRLGEGMHPSLAAGHLVFSRLLSGQGGDLFRMPFEPGVSAAPVPVVQGPDQELEPALSPDGSLLAYASGPAGQTEVLLRTFPIQTEQWRVSSAGGSTPVWSRSGDVLYYRSASGPTLLLVDVQRSPTLTLSTPRAITRPSTLLARTGFDVSLDGTRLLMVQEVKADDSKEPALAVVHHWPLMLKR
jgi:serine/threonine-protein kinase